MHWNVAETEAYLDKLLTVNERKTAPNADPAKQIASFREQLDRMVRNLSRVGGGVRTEQEETTEGYIIHIRVPKGIVDRTDLRVELPESEEKTIATKRRSPIQEVLQEEPEKETACFT